MRVLVLSDIHANLNALEAVLGESGTVDAVWCLGDLVGYGPDPNECIEIVRTLPNITCLLGNHDAAVVERIKNDSFNLEARKSIDWIRSILTEKSLSYLKNLPETYEIGDSFLAHGSPRNPIWEYILDTSTARINLDFSHKKINIVGHTHLPVAYYEANRDGKVNWRLLQPGEPQKIIGAVILNPGSVGQPRDHDARASYAIFDTDNKIWQQYRVEYDVVGVQRRIYNFKLPLRNALRLAEGW